MRTRASARKHGQLPRAGDGLFMVAGKTISRRSLFRPEML
jgi:hypothetical protein